MPAVRNAASFRSRAPRFALGIAAVMVCLGDRASAQPSWVPSGFFYQAGTASDTHTLTSGLTWDWGRDWAMAGGRLGGYWELSVSRWSYQTTDERRQAWLGQMGVVPTFRYRGAEGMSPWFFEFGIGASLTTTLYETQRKRFSTTFNFADRVGVGRNFGPSGQHEISLRMEHFSNAGIKRPNPGENFAQLRYGYRFR